MVKVAALLLLMSAVTPSNTALTGKWRLHGWIDGNDLESECNFAQSGRTLRGTCTSEQGPVEITGQVKDSVVLWSYQADYNGTSSTIQYTGSFYGRRISGKIAVDPDGAKGQFTADLVR